MSEGSFNAEPCGVVVVDKPAGMTSFDVVAKMRRVYGTRRIGHTGTLDPMATGVLVVLVGRAAKAVEFVSTGRKVYDAVLKLGVVTDTEDTTGNVVKTHDVTVTGEEVRAAAESFCGEYMQTPPMYSAKKRGGEKLYDLARRGITVEREPCRVEVYSIATSSTGRDDEYALRVSCSGGTYIRTLCADIGARLGCGGCMASLRRLETGGFDIGRAHTIEEIESAPEACLDPTESLFSGLCSAMLSERDEFRIRNGQSVRIAGDAADGERIRLCGQEGFFALGEVKDGTVRQIRLFVL